jgi:hypothetical protein
MRILLQLFGLFLIFLAGLCGLCYYNLHKDPEIAAQWARDAEEAGAFEHAKNCRSMEEESRIKNYVWIGVMALGTPLGAWLVLRPFFKRSQPVAIQTAPPSPSGSA